MMALSVACVLGAREVEAAPPASDEVEGSTVSLVFDASVLGSAVAARLEPQLSEQLVPVLAEGDLQMVGAPDFGEQTLSVRVVGFDEEQLNYEVELELSGPGGVVTKLPARCDACTERRLIGKVVEEAPRLLDMHEKDLEAASSEPPPIAEPPRDTQLQSEGPKSLIGARGIAGASMLGVGVLTLAAGGYLLGRQADTDADQRKENTYYLPAAVSVVAAGVALAGVGATLLGLDLERNRKRRFAIQMTPTYVGIQLNQRF